MSSATLAPVVLSFHSDASRQEDGALSPALISPEPAASVAAPTTATPVVRRTGRPRDPLTHLAYLIAESLTEKLGENGQALLAKLFGGTPPRTQRGLTVCRLAKLFLEHCETYYVDPAGNPTGEVYSMERTMDVLKQHYGRSRAAEFGPLKLKRLREEMIKLDWCRKTINHNVNRVKQAFKWGVENELLPPERFHALQAVPGLRMGRSLARESEPVKPVPESVVEATLPHLSAHVASMVRLQLLTGMRPGEVIILRTRDVDRTGAIWIYTPSKHKTAHHGHGRQVFIGPQAQKVLEPFLKPDEPEAYCFSAADAEKERLRKKHAARKTPMNEGNKPGSNVKRRPKRRPGHLYRRDSYTRAICRGCEAAFPVPAGLDAEGIKRWRKEHHWHPHQLRHTAATKLRKLYGIDAAQIILGHKTLAVTAIYAERDAESAMKIMREIG